MEKAFLIKFNYIKKTESGSKVTVQFNPSSYSITGGNSYEVNANVLNSAYRGFLFTFTGRNASVLSAELVFDSYRHGEAEQQDVRKKWFADLSPFLLVNPQEHTPLVLKFAWGTLSFVGVITSMSESYTMFGDNGRPVRAKITLKITGCREEDLVTQANESPDRTKLRTVCQKDTLWSLAEQEYGSGEQWRVIALANGIENPRKLTQTSRLVLPALPGGEESYG